MGGGNSSFSAEYSKISFLILPSGTFSETQPEFSFSFLYTGLPTKVKTVKTI